MRQWVKTFRVRDDETAKALRTHILKVRTGDAHVYATTDVEAVAQFQDVGINLGAVKVQLGNRAEIFTLDEAEALGHALLLTVAAVDVAVAVQRGEVDVDALLGVA